MVWSDCRVLIWSLVRVVWIDVDVMQCWTGFGEKASGELELEIDWLLSSSGQREKNFISLLYSSKGGFFELLSES